MNKKLILIFLLGFFSCALLFYVLGFSDLEVPFVTGFISFENNAESPSDWVSNEDIIILEDKIILNIPHATLSNYASSGSMRPFLDKGANGIRIKPSNETQIEVGDIISYKSFGFLVVHRVVERGIDSKGVYFIPQGDSNVFQDGKIRFEDIEYVTIGIIY